MSLIANIILANTPEAKAAAEAKLQQHNALQPSDREVVSAFLKDCTTLDGKPLVLDDDGKLTLVETPV